MSGGIVKVHRPDVPFVQVPNSTAQDSKLSPAALGLLTYLGSLPEDWEIRDRHIQNHFRIGKDALRTIYVALTEAGFARRLHRVRQPGGTFTTETTVALEPIFDRCGFSASGQPVGGKPPTKERKTEKEKHTKKEPVPSGDGKESGSTSPTRLDFEKEFGIRIVPAADQIPIPRLLGIVRFQKLEFEDLKFVFCELQAIAENGGFRESAERTFGDLAKRASGGDLCFSARGEAVLQQFGGLAF